MAEAVAGLQLIVPHDLPHCDLEGRLSRTLRGLRGFRRQDRDLLLKTVDALLELVLSLAMHPLAAARLSQDAAYGCAQALARAQFEEAQPARQACEPDGARCGLR